MATAAAPMAGAGRRPDLLSGEGRAHALDRWIYVIMAALLIAATLTGFIPDSLGKLAAVKAGARPPFPMVLHLHAVLMGSFMLLLLAQTTLVATGRCERHMRVGRLGMVLVPAIVIVGLLLVPTMYHQVSDGARFGPPEVRAKLLPVVPMLDDIMLLQLRIGLLFPLFIFIGLRARGADSGLHKRMMILAAATPMPAAIDRMTWLPTTLPASPLATDLYLLALLSPMIAWDIARNRTVHRAYLIWAGCYVAAAAVVYSLWDTPWWHRTAQGLMGA